MSVYVDDMEANFGRMVMCHMMADSTKELLAMADKIGVARKWIQKRGTRYEHFDICKSKKMQAINRGAIEMTQRELCLHLYPPRKKGEDAAVRSSRIHQVSLHRRTRNI
jgi:hypothetical protein